MTPKKKHYAGILWCQEGNIFEKPEPDIKGLALRKTSVNYNLRQYFNKTLMDKILNPKEINLIDVYKDYANMEENIKESLSKGETVYSEPGKVNDINSYAVPYTQQTVRGTLLWNAMHPDNPIQPPTKVNFIKITPMNYLQFIEKLPQPYSDNVLNLYNDKTTQASANCPKALKDYEVNILCFPKNVKKLDSFLIDFIDKDIMVMDSIRPCMEILAPLGFKTLDINTNSFSTNIIKL